MAQRDYVRKKSKPKNNSRIIPNLMMAVAVILVILFVAILYFVSTNKSNKPAAQVKTITEKPSATLPEKPQDRWTYLKELENPDNNQPVTQQVAPTTQDKERQQALENFMNDKPQSNQANSPTNNVNNNEPSSAIAQPVQVTQPTSTQNTTPSADTDKWSLQCGAFKDKSNAESLKAKLAMFGVTSVIKSEKYHRVIAGPYNSKSEAEKTITTLKNNGISSCITTKK